MASEKIVERIGDVFQIPFGDGSHGYGHVIGSVLVGYYAIQTTALMSLEDILGSEVAFRVQTDGSAIADGRWPIVGHAHPPAAMTLPLSFRRGRGASLKLYEWTFPAGGNERRATLEEVEGLDEQVIWPSDLVAKRLWQHLHGEPYSWTLGG